MTRMSQSRSYIVGFAILTCIFLRMNGESLGILLFQGMMLFFHHFLMLISRYIISIIITIFVVLKDVMIQGHSIYLFYYSLWSLFGSWEKRKGERNKKLNG